MPNRSMIQRSPIRVFERAIGGGLAPGHLGVVLSRHGGGKTGFLIGLAVDQLLQGRNVLYISTKESIEHITSYFDQIFHAMAKVLQFDEVPQKQLQMERNRHILVYNRDLFSLQKLQQSAAFLKEAAGFVPAMVVMDGTPRFESTEDWELSGLKELAAGWGAGVWTSSNTHREGQKADERGVPLKVARHDGFLEVIVMLCPENEHIRVKIIKERATVDIPQVHLELDPGTMLLRWR